MRGFYSPLTAILAYMLLGWTSEMMSPEVIWAFDLDASGMPPLGNVSKGKGPTWVCSRAFLQCVRPAQGAPRSPS